MLLRQMDEREMEHWYAHELSEAFAPNERKPLADIRCLIAEGRYELWGPFDGEKMAGYAAIWKAEGIPLVLLDYLGVSRALRGGGLGAEILAKLRGQGRLIVTEAELPVPGAGEEENRLRLRRIAFYRRNGFTPAYQMATCGMRWQALLSGPRQDGRDSMEKIMKWHKELYGPERTDVVVPLAPHEQPRPPYWMQ